MEALAQHAGGLANKRARIDDCESELDALERTIRNIPDLGPDDEDQVPPIKMKSAGKRAAVNSDVVSKQCNLLNDLLMLSAEPHSLILAIHRQAQHFLEPDCLNQLKRHSYPWLKDCLLELDIDSSFTIVQVLGIMMALAAIGGSACSRIPMLMQQLDAHMHKQVHQQFEIKLGTLFPDPDVCRWFAENIEQMNCETYQIANYLISHGIPDPACYLQLSRLVKVSDRLDYYITICNKLVATRRYGMLEEHMK